jgi:hypothetical protein
MYGHAWTVGCALVSSLRSGADRENAECRIAPIQGQAISTRHAVGEFGNASPFGHALAPIEGLAGDGSLRDHLLYLKKIERAGLDIGVEQI